MCVCVSIQTRMQFNHCLVYLISISCLSLSLPYSGCPFRNSFFQNDLASVMDIHTPVKLDVNRYQDDPVTEWWLLLEWSMDQGHSTSAKMVFSLPDLTSLNATMETGPAFRLLVKKVRTHIFPFPFQKCSLHYSMATRKKPQMALSSSYCSLLPVSRLHRQR